MALKKDFYIELFEKEENWIKMINNPKGNLLTSTYCKFELKPFYLEKIKELENEQKQGNNQIIQSLYFGICDILNKLNEFIEKFEESKRIDFKELLPLFCINIMRNEKFTIREEKNDINLLEPAINDLKKEELGELRNKVVKYMKKGKKESNPDYDYVFDTFYDEEPKKTA